MVVGSGRFVFVSGVVVVSCLVSGDGIGCRGRYGWEEMSGAVVVVLLACLRFRSWGGSFDCAGLVLVLVFVVWKPVRSADAELIMGGGMGAGIGIILWITRAKAKNVLAQHDTAENVH